MQQDELPNKKRKITMDVIVKPKPQHESGEEASSLY
jgi:hypothetical protein